MNICKAETTQVRGSMGSTVLYPIRYVLVRSAKYFYLICCFRILSGVVQGIITGMRGLCSGLGPAVFGFIFYLFHVDLNPDLPDDGTHRVRMA